MRVTCLLLVSLIYLTSYFQETPAQDSPPGAAGRASPPLTAATLCIHNGGDSFVAGFPPGNSNQGGGKYFPSFTHWTATSMGNLGKTYPWKIRGMGWTGMQSMASGPTWYWESCLQKTRDNPYATTMSWDYPVLHCNGTVPHSGPPMPIYGGAVPSMVPIIGNNALIFPSSMRISPSTIAVSTSLPLT